MFSIVAIPVTIFILVDPDAINTTTPSVDLNPCHQPLNLGFSSSNGSHFKYFFDLELKLCFPYRTTGEDEGRNSFDTEKRCRDRCLTEDHFVCGANTRPIGTCSSIRRRKRHHRCPADHICKKGSFINMCCLRETEESFNQDWNPSCPDGMSLITTKKEYGEDVYRGKRCDHSFCPNNSTCYEGKWIAYCCQEGRNGTEVLM